MSALVAAEPRANHATGARYSDERPIDEPQEQVRRGKERDTPDDVEPDGIGAVEREERDGHRGHEQRGIQARPVALPEESGEAAARRGHRDERSDDPQRHTERHM